MGPKSITSVVRERGRVTETQRKGHVKTGQRPEGCGHKPREAGVPGSWRRGRRTLSQDLQREHSPVTP